MDANEVLELGIEPDKLEKLFVFSFDLAMALSSKVEVNSHGKIHDAGNGCYVKVYANSYWWFDKHTDEKIEEVVLGQLRYDVWAPWFGGEK